MRAFKTLFLRIDANQRAKPFGWSRRYGKRIAMIFILMLFVFFLMCGAHVSASEMDSANLTVSDGDVVSSVVLLSGTASGNNTVDSVIYTSYEEFMESPLYVTRYENEVLNKLEFIQYALAIIIAALFLLIFKKK